MTPRCLVPEECRRHDETLAEVTMPKKQRICERMRSDEGRSGAGTTKMW